MSTNNDSELNLSHGSEISYEEEQLQQLLIQESEKQKIAMDRELREAQEKEYQKCLAEDTAEVPAEVPPALTFEEVSLEEMRRVRIEKFENKLKDKCVE